MKFPNLYQDPENDSDAPYADTLVLDAGGLDVKYSGETVAHVSFEGLDPFELAYHALPDDFERHEDLDGTGLGLTITEGLENLIANALDALAVARGWERA